MFYVQRMAYLLADLGHKVTVLVADERRFEPMHGPARRIAFPRRAVASKPCDA